MKKTILIRSVELLISLLIAFVISNVLHISNFKYLLLIIVFFFCVSVIFESKKLLYQFKEYIDGLIIMAMILTLFLPLCISTFVYKETYLTIKPIKSDIIDSTKNNEIWIYDMKINGKKISYEKIQNSSWRKVGDNFVYTGNEYNPVKIKIRNRVDKIKITYAKANDLVTDFEINGKVYETYGSEWSLKDIYIKNIEQEKKDILPICLSILCYYIFGFVLFIMTYPFIKKSKCNYLIPISCIYMYSVYYYNEIFLVTGFLILFISYFLLRNWSVANEENSK